MSEVARLNDSIYGITSGEHSGHSLNPHSPLPITGNISDNCSLNVFCNGIAVAHKGSVTTEVDGCCGSSSGSIAQGSSTVFVNNIPVSRKGDSISAHSGTAIIDSGSSNVFAN